MKLIQIIFFFTLLISFQINLEAQTVRKNININREWKFKLGDYSSAEVAGFDDSNWENIGIPHSFSMPYYQSAQFYKGYGWYRKYIDIPAEWIGKRISLDFEGAYRTAEIFVNGELVGKHNSGYTGFEIDITKAIKTGRNVVAVRLNNLWDSRVAPRAGEHVFSGGIYRDVKLVVTDPLHVAWYGTFVTTPNVSAKEATVNVKTEVINERKVTVAATVITLIIDSKGAVVAKFSSAKTIAAGKTVFFDQTSAVIKNPKLWSPKTPNLYSVKTIIKTNGKEVDDFISPLGFRSIKFTADKGFFLNGERYYFKGANVHQDRAGWGDAVTNNAFLRDIKMMKEAGFDFIRGSHYPHDPAFVEACDKEGMLFWSEVPFWGSGGTREEGDYEGSNAYPTNPEDWEAFDKSVLEQMTDMIRIHRNHPSVIVWSTSNEPFFTTKETLEPTRKLLKKEVDLGHQLDPTRPVAIGGCQRGDMDKIGDIAGYNGDGARLFINPGVASVVSEYGSTETFRPGKYIPGWGDLPLGQNQDKSKKYPWHYDWRSGEAIWCGFDHGSVAGKRFGSMGIVDYARIPKRSYYWYRNEYTGVAAPPERVQGTAAAIQLTTDKSVIVNDGTDDAHLLVSIVDGAGVGLSNSPEVKLSIESGPGEFPTGRTITFNPKSDIEIIDGLAAAEFRSYFGGETVIRATSQGLKDAVVKIITKGLPQFTEGKSPVVISRPYVPFTANDSKNSISSFGLNNPTRASNEMVEHSSGLVGDGNPDTFWQAADNKSGNWWQVDLERNVKMEQIKLTFPKETKLGYKIETLNTDNQWTTIVDLSNTSSASKVRIEKLSQSVSGRFIRVTFTNIPEGESAKLSELEVLGSILE
ncbi:F5/8 type C domain-containing protein [Flavobacterium glycines]|uniref:Beta-galactosidase n=1 Tax=Flavobacterium glycines TaxID=551990 RepID=A0A1B9DP42_9FLAO|nr:glycoside hydrolase family 2 TIM barrel-domain containing protein [Flavobacterium glycines]OCB71466.1 beta-galactosidase [Flavobacterium glycines]GEL10488.1 beta-galactosidase [Flavobacterium glycines]SDI66008.1 F5/8 type C domain-containing protein [Flavobacterium glycines]